MNSPHFLRIERDQHSGPHASAGSAGKRHFVVHLAEPRLALELVPDAAAPNRVGRGIIKRVCVPNSWAGDYGQYGKWIAAAQEFFEQAAAEPEALPARLRRGR